jgi:hypothetical protein
MTKGSQNNGGPVRKRPWQMLMAADLEQSDRWRLMGQA